MGLQYVKGRGVVPWTKIYVYRDKGDKTYKRITDIDRIGPDGNPVISQAERDERGFERLSQLKKQTLKWHITLYGRKCIFKFLGMM